MLRYITETTWALEASVAQKMAEVLSAHLNGERPDAGVVEAVVEERRRRIKARAERDGVVSVALEGLGTEDEARGPERMGSVGVIPVDGFLTPYASMINGMSQPGGTTVAQLEEWISAAVADPSIRCILLDIDSPGGTAAGMDDLARAVKAADAAKPVYAYAHDQATSAAYLMGSQARSFYCSSMGVTGSIGVMVMLRDTSAAETGKGVKLHLVRSAPFKGAGAPGAPVSESDLASVQQRVDQLHAAFVKMVAEGRGVSLEKASALADGKAHVGAAAEGLGLVDGVIGFRDLVARLNDVHGHTSPAAGRRAVMIGKGTAMLKLDDLMVQHPALMAEHRERVVTEQRATLTAEAKAEAEKGRPKPAGIADLKQAFPGAEMAAFRETCLEQALTLDQAKAALAGELKTQNTALAAERDTLKKRVGELESLGDKGKGTVPVGASPGGGGGAGATFEDAVRAHALEKKLSIPRACAELAEMAQHREAHADWLKRKSPLIKAA